MQDATLLVVLLALAAASSTSSPSSTKWREWTDKEVRDFRDTVSATGIEPAHALLVYCAESGLNPAASSGAAWGLAQFTEQTLRGHGFKGSGRDFARLSVSDQLPFVGKLLRTQIRFIGYVPESAVELYVANFNVIAARERRDQIYREYVPDEARAYRSNRGLDLEKKGWISVDDLAVRLERESKNPRYLSTLARLEGGP